MVLLFQRVSHDRCRRGRSYTPTWAFAGGYLAVWTAYGLVAYGFYRLVVGVGAGFLAWDRTVRGGERLTRVFAVAFVATGVWVAVAPGSVPGLTQPSGPGAPAQMKME